MVCTANDLQAWTDFPKGLRVLLLDQDTDSSSEIRSKLEAMDYVVSTFCDENEALSAIANEPDSFHIAIVEVNTSSDGSFNFLGSTRDLPIIMMSSNHCLSTMMKCIALGAVEFLHKPLCEDKLRNIWQHVVHKAFNAGVGTISETLRPVKQSVASMLHLQSENGIHKNDASMEMVSMSVCETDNEQSAGSDKYPAPSTPQLKQGARLLDDGDCHDQTNCSVEKESTDPDEESKFVDMTCDESGAQNLPEGLCQDQRLGQGLVKGEDESADNTNCETAVSPNSQSKYGSHGSHGCNNNPSKRTGLHNSTGTRVNRKKMKVDWTAELHKKFVQAVEQLGVDQAIPSRILELMKVEGLTRHNVASHLQKYRMHKRHILPKEDDRRWPHHRDVVSRSYYPHRPIMAYPPYHSSHPLQPGTVYPIWPPAPPLPLPPGNHPTGMQMWCPPGYPPWHAHYPGMHADAWGCPVLPPSHGPAFTFPAQSAPGNHYAGAVDHGLTGSSTFDYHLAEEVVDKVVKEAISKPWLPLPLGLKPPSTDCVLAELTRQGIPCIPPRSVHP